MRRRHFPAGTTIFSEGDVSDQAYILRSGRVEVLKETPAGPVRLAIMGPGDVLGEMGLLDERPRSASAHALESVAADAVSAAEFVAMLNGDPAKSMEILRALFERHRHLTLRVSEQVPMPVGDSTIPLVKLVPMTPQTRAVLPADGLVVTRFPFRLGRKPEADATAALRFNEIDLPDAQPYLLSPHHFALDLGPGGVVVRDRGSQHGTLVNGTPIGAASPHDFCALRHRENEIVAGAVRCPPRGASHPFASSSSCRDAN